MHLNDTIREMIYTAFADHDEHRKQEPMVGAAISAAPRKVADADSVPLGSLCLSCVKRATCSRPGRSAGVWHCEEYF